MLEEPPCLKYLKKNKNKYQRGRVLMEKEKKLNLCLKCAYLRNCFREEGLKVKLKSYKKSK